MLWKLLKPIFDWKYCMDNKPNFETEKFVVLFYEKYKLII